jgi:hypothetical protein
MLEFLAQATWTDVAEQPTTTKKGGTQKKERIPSGLAIRVFRDGSVYPSAELVEKFDLEYGPKDCDGCGNGFDVIDTRRYSELRFPKDILLISPVSRRVKHGKVDLFAAVGYNADNSPKSTVSNQGASTYGKEELLPMLKEIYGLELTKDSNPDYIDLQLVTNPVTNQPWELPNGRQVTYIPKKKSRGAEKGVADVVRREKPQFWALIPASLIEGTDERAGNREAQQTDSEDDMQAKLSIDKAVAKHAKALVTEEA